MKGRGGEQTKDHSRAATKLLGFFAFAFFFFLNCAGTPNVVFMLYKLWKGGLSYKDSWFMLAKHRSLLSCLKEQ